MPSDALALEERGASGATLDGEKLCYSKWYRSKCMNTHLCPVSKDHYRQLGQVSGKIQRAWLVKLSGVDD